MPKRSFSIHIPTTLFQSPDDSKLPGGTFTLHGKPRRCGGFRMWTKSLRRSCAENVVFVQVACGQIAHRELCLLRQWSRKGNSWIFGARNFDFLKEFPSKCQVDSHGVGWWKGEKSSELHMAKKRIPGIPFLQAACCVNRWLTILESHIWSFPFQVRPVTSAGNRAKVSLEIFDLIKEGWSLATHQFMDLMISFRP